jgi:hypothetical protein
MSKIMLRRLFFQHGFEFIINIWTDQHIISGVHKINIDAVIVHGALCFRAVDPERVIQAREGPERPLVESSQVLIGVALLCLVMRLLQVEAMIRQTLNG